MSVYDTQEAAIARQRMIAAALRQSGNAAPEDVTRSAGGYVIPISPWQSFGKLASQAVGAYGDAQSNKEEKALSDTKRKDAASWLRGMNDVQNYQDPLQPVEPTGTPQMPAEPTPQDIGGLQQFMQNRSANQQAGADQSQADAAARKPMMIAQYLKGLDLGGVPAALSQQGMERTMTPKIYDPIKVSDGDKVFDINGATPRLLADGGPKEFKAPQDQLATMNIVDPKAPGGYRTIRKTAFTPEMQEYQKPPVDPYAALNDPKMIEMAKRQAMEVYTLKRPPPSTNNRNPYNMEVLDQLSMIGTERGAPYDAVKYPARAAALTQFNPGKKAGDTVRSFSVLLDHLDTLEAAAGALKNGDLPALNAMKQWFKENTGKAPPATFEALKDNIRGEIVKAITGTPGAESDRQEALAKLSKASSPEALAGVFAGLRTLAGGQLDGLRRQWVSTTQLPEEEFNSRLSAAAQRLHGFEAQKDLAPAAAGAAKAVVPGAWKVEEVK